MPDSSDDLPAVLASTYAANVTPLKTGGRADWHVPRSMEIAPVQSPDFIDAMRRFFDGMDREIDHYVNDPIATSQAFARVEALLADLRYVRDRLRDVTAESMNAQKMRRLTVEHVATVEATSAVEWDWDDHKVLRDLLGGWRILDPDTGEVIDADDAAEYLLTFASVGYWRSTALKAAGLDPDRLDYRDAPRDEDGKIVRRPTLRVNDNLIRRNR